MLIDLTEPVGAELSRRWLAALLLVPEGEREAVIEAVERQVAREYERREDTEPGAGEGASEAGANGT